MTGERKRLQLDQIKVPNNRIRQMDEAKAQLMAASVATHGMLHPIIVHRSSAAERPYTLISGLHRLRVAEILGHPEVDVVIRTAGEARQIEIAENLFRNDLSALERAEFAREWFLENNIRPGKPSAKRNSAMLAELFPGRDVSQLAVDQLGFSGRTARRLAAVARDLHPGLKARFHGTPIANNLSLLSKVIKLGPTKQAELLQGLKNGLDAKTAIGLLTSRPKEARPSRDASYIQFLASWLKLTSDEKRRFLGRVAAGSAPDLAILDASLKHELGELIKSDNAAKPRQKNAK